MKLSFSAGMVMVLLICSLPVHSDSGPATLVPASRSPEEMKRLVGAILDKRFQVHLPEEKPVAARPEPKPPPSDHRNRRFSTGYVHHSPGPRSVANPAPDYFFKILLILSGVLVLSWVIFLLVGKLQQKSGGTNQNNAAVPVAPVAEPAVLAGELDDAEKLAGEGRFAEAIHQVLLLALSRFSQRRALALSVSHTSREILGRIAPDTSCYIPLRTLILMVERTHFGTFTCTAPDFARSVSLYRQLSADGGPV